MSEQPKHARPTGTQSLAEKWLDDFEDLPWWVQTLICLPFALAFFWLFAQVLNWIDPYWVEHVRAQEESRDFDQ
jgi:hypothetical protein